MPKINIDELCEPIEVTIGGKKYTVEDIPRELALRMSKLDDGEADPDIDAIKELSDIMAEVLGADKADIAKLGMRKLTLLMAQVMSTVNEEIVGKNAPEAEATK